MNTVKADQKALAETAPPQGRPNLTAMLSPRTVALIGASESPGSVGRALMENLQSFGDRVFPVNPTSDCSRSKSAFANRRRPQKVDLAVIATPAATCRIVGECAAAVKGAVIISAGFKSRPAGAELEKQILTRRGGCESSGRTVSA